ncbi:MAG: T9SS type A sorting domain-containing protein, partial [Ignavibacteriaceae bacterium]
VVSEYPELININFVSSFPNSLGADWNHINAVDYNEDLDQIILSVHHFGEIWIIDHSTTTEEAAGHFGGNSGMGGDLLYRWGNPQTYDRGDVTDQMLFGQHDSHWIESGLPGEGNILIFNNGRNRPGGDYSTVDEIVPPVDQNGNYLLEPGTTYGPDQLLWTYVDPVPSDFYSPNVSGSQRQPNGNTLICSGTWGRFFEVTNEGELVWLYVNPVIATGPMFYEDPIPSTQNWAFRVYRYAADYPGFEGRDLTPGDPIELYDPTSIEEINLDLIPKQFELFQNYPNPFNPSTKIKFALPTDDFVNLTIYNVLGKTIAVIVNEQIQAGSYEVVFDASDLSSGMYFYKLTAGKHVNIKKMLLIK